MDLAQTKINTIINQVLDEEGLTPKELVIGGFRQFFLSNFSFYHLQQNNGEKSQGGALAYHTAFNHYDELAGILGRV